MTRYVSGRALAFAQTLARAETRAAEMVSRVSQDYGGEIIVAEDYMELTI